VSEVLISLSIYKVLSGNRNSYRSSYKGRRNGYSDNGGHRHGKSGLRSYISSYSNYRSGCTGKRSIYKAL
jgi:hypothetical protein